MSEATIENEQAEGLDTLNDERARRLVTRMSYIEDGVNPYPEHSEVSDYVVDIDAKYADLGDGENTEDIVKIGGRIVAKRGQGKIVFVVLRDTTGDIQLFCRINDMAESDWTLLGQLDLGDIINVEGAVVRTKRGQLSVAPRQIKLLSKAVRPLPEKFHGLSDKETRYRQRYVDLIVNEDVRDTFRKRSAILSAFRRYMEEDGYMEVETPILQTIQGGATAKPFITHFNALDQECYLRIATELHLKRLIVGGFEQVYEIGRIFRNEGMDTKHNPEFTTIELYQAYTDYHGMMDITEDMVVHVCEKVLGTTKVTYQGLELDFSKGWRRMTMADAVKEYAGLDFMAMSQEEALAAVRAKGVEVEPGKESWGDLLAQCYDAFVEENLLQPTFIIDYPVEISPLAKRKASDPRLTERFECFVAGRELCNAFSELNDPIDQRARFERQVALRAAGDDEANMMDDDFINALEYGMPPTGGMGMGIDRLVMFLTDSASIRDVLLFPTMKPLDGKPGETAGAAAAAPKAEKPDFSKVKIEPLFEETVDFETFSRSDFRAVKIEACEAVPKSKKLLQFTLNDGTARRRTILSGIHEYYEPEELIGKTAIAIVNLPPRKMMGIESEGMLISAVHEEDGREGLNLLLVDDRIPAGAKLY